MIIPKIQPNTPIIADASQINIPIKNKQVNISAITNVYHTIK